MFEIKIKSKKTGKEKSIDCTLKELLKNGIDDIVDNLTECDCEPTSESNILECNCYEEWNDIELEIKDIEKEKTIKMIENIINNPMGDIVDDLLNVIKILKK